MAVIEGLTSGVGVESGAASAAPLHVTAKPVPYSTLGHYRIAVQAVANAGLGANTEYFQFRWSDATRLCLVHRVRITGLRATTAFAAGVIDIKMTVARSWSVSGSGGTAATLTGDNQQMRTSMGASLVGDMRVITTTALGAGTKTLDTHDIGWIATHSSAGWSSATPIIGALYLPTDTLFDSRIGDGEHPLVLAQNEGFAIRCTFPATGVPNMGIEVVWSEVTAF